MPVPDLDSGLEFYRDKLGHELKWRNDEGAGLSMGESETEIVLHTRLDRYEPDLLVQSADDAAKLFEDSGGTVLAPPFDIPVGRVAVVRDPLGNVLSLVDLSKGIFQVDPETKQVLTVSEAAGDAAPG
ncbi:MAG: VOC family protein [Dehalococcoidia bacterium]